MSEVGQEQLQDQFHNIASTFINQTSEGRDLEDPTSDRLPLRRPLAPGALRLLQVYELEQGQRAKGKGGIISPQKVLFEWIKKLVCFLLKYLWEFFKYTDLIQFPLLLLQSSTLRC